jgi:hypothetical protein
LNKILPELNHPAIASKEVEEEHRQEVDSTYVAKSGEELITEGEKIYCVTKTKKTVV